MNVKDLNLSAHEIVKICGCSLATAYNWISGKGEPKISQWRKLEDFSKINDRF